MPKLKPDKRSKVFKKEVKNQQRRGVTKEYIKNMATSTPSYVLSLPDRYEQSYRVAKLKIDKALQSASSNPAILANLNKKIVDLEKEELALADKFVSLFGYNKNIDSRKHMLSMLGLNFNIQVKESGFELNQLADLIKFRIGEVYNQEKALDYAQGSVSSFYRSLSESKREKYKLQLTNLQTLLKDIKIEQVQDSPILTRLITMIKEDEGLKALARSKQNFGDLRGLGGILAEPVMGLLMINSLMKMESRVSNIFYKGKSNRTRIVSDIDKIVGKAIGSDAAGESWLTNSIIDSIAPLNAKGKRSIRTGTNLAGQAANKTIDYLINITSNSGDLMNLAIDMKNPLATKKDIQNMDYISYSQRSWGDSSQESGIEALAKSTNFPPEISEALQYYMFILMSYTNIKGKLDQKDLVVLSKIITYIIALSDNTINKFYSDMDTGHANIVLIGGKFYFMSYVLKSIIKTYYKTTNTIISDARSLTIDASSLEGVTKSLENGDNQSLLALKQSAARKVYPKKFESRIGNVIHDSKVEERLREYEVASKSVSFKLRYTLNLYKIKNNIEEE